jgi:hypothetical protein
MTTPGGTRTPPNAHLHPPVLGAPASIRVAVTQPARLQSFALPHPKHQKPLLASWVVLARLLLLRRVCGLLFFLYYLQTFDLLEGEAHDAAVLALVLKVDCLVVVVDHDLRRNPAAVVEPLRSLRDVFVHYLLGLLAHPRLLLSSLVFLYPEEAPYIPQEGTLSGD